MAEFPGCISLLFGLFEREGPAHRSCLMFLYPTKNIPNHGWVRFSFSVIWSKPRNSSTLRPHLRDQKFRLTKIPLTFDHRPLTKWVWVFQWHRSWWRCLWNGGTWNLDQEKLVLTCFFFFWKTDWSICLKSLLNETLYMPEKILLGVKVRWPWLLSLPSAAGGVASWFHWRLVFPLGRAPKKQKTHGNKQVIINWDPFWGSSNNANVSQISGASHECMGWVGKIMTSCNIQGWKNWESRCPCG